MNRDLLDLIVRMEKLAFELKQCAGEIKRYSEYASWRMNKAADVTRDDVLKFREDAQ